MTAVTASFEEVEREAVLQGNPAPLPGSRPIPEARWSYHPGGFLTRYFPEHYSRSRIEVSVPAAIQVQRDDQGRIAEVTDELGSRLTISYADATPVRLPGDAGLRASAVREIRTIPPEGEAAAVGGGWAFAGLPQEKGSPAGAPAQFTGLSQRHARVWEHVRDVSRLVAALSDPARKPPAEAAIATGLADIMDLAHLADAVRPSVPEGDEEAAEAVVLRTLQHAWQGALCQRMASLPGARLRPGEMARRPGDGTRLATLGLPRALLSQAVSDGGLPVLDPGWDGMNPGNRGRQRLGTAPMQHPASDGKQVLHDAVSGCEFLSAALDVFNGLTDPVSWILEKFGLGAGGMPGMMLGELVQALFDAGASISQALGGDPPRADYTVFDLPAPPELPLAEAAPGLSAARARTANTAAAGLRDMYVSLRAAQVSLDRLGGALQAGDEGWARRQALALVHYKRQAGERMVAASEQYDALLEVMQDEGAEAKGIELAQLQVHQQALREQGLRPASVAALRRLGLNDEEIEATRQRRLAFVPEDDLGDPIYLAGHVTEGLWDLGEYWLTLPEAPAPLTP
jgi:hypothetical protein